MTLIEMVVAMGVGSLVFLVLGTVSLYSARSFSSMAEYSNLNRISRAALDQISREIRQSKGLLSYTPSTNGTTMTFKDASGTFLLVYDNPTQCLDLIWPGVKTNRLSKECTYFNVRLFQKSPIANTFNFVETTDPLKCKVVQLDWSCERRAAPTFTNSESIQSMKIVIRKKPD